jgi:hypothetical protein
MTKKKQKLSDRNLYDYLLHVALNLEYKSNPEIFYYKLTHDDVCEDLEVSSTTAVRMRQTGIDLNIFYKKLKEGIRIIFTVDAERVKELIHELEVKWGRKDA